MQDQINKLNDKLDHITKLVELLVESGALKKKAPRQRISDIPIDKVNELREAELERIFNRMANASAALKTKLNFSKRIVQPFGARPYQMVPLSLILNRCELLKAFWPVAGSPEPRPPRDTAEMLVNRFVKRGMWCKAKISDYFPNAAGTRTGSTIIILTREERLRRLQAENDIDLETGERVYATPAPVVPARRERKPWEDSEEDDAPRPKLQWPTPAPRVTEPEDEDEEIPVAPATSLPAKTPPGKPRFFTDDDEGIETGAAQPAKKSWSIGEDSGENE